MTTPDIDPINFAPHDIPLGEEVFVLNEDHGKYTVLRGYVGAHIRKYTSCRYTNYAKFGVTDEVRYLVQLDANSSTHVLSDSKEYDEAFVFTNPNHAFAALDRIKKQSGATTLGGILRVDPESK